MKRVDVTGEVCPRPVLILRQELVGMEPGDEVLVRGDYTPAERNIRRTCERHGFAVEDVGDADDAFELRIGVTEDASIPED